MQRFLRVLGFKRFKQNLQVEQSLAEALDAQAQKEQRAPEALAADLLARGLALRKLSDESLELWESLSPREREVVALICLGYLYKEIAKKLGISHDTVKTHVNNALRKLRAHKRGDIQRMLADWDFSEWDR